MWLIILVYICHSLIFMGTQENCRDKSRLKFLLTNATQAFRADSFPYINVMQTQNSNSTCLCWCSNNNKAVNSPRHHFKLKSLAIKRVKDRFAVGGEFIYTGCWFHSGRQIHPNNYQEEDFQIAWNGINRSMIVMGERWGDASCDSKNAVQCAAFYKGGKTLRESFWLCICDICEQKTRSIREDQTPADMKGVILNINLF